jgi:G3E family GTPase
VLQTFFFDDELREQLELDAVVTMVDAAHIERDLAETRECAEQIAFADVVVLNKVDLVDPGAVDAVEERVRELNPRARVIRAERARVDLAEVLDVGAFDLDRALEVDPAFMSRDGHDHEHSPIAAVGLVVEGDLDGTRFDSWLGDLLQEIGPDVFRFKGALAIAGGPHRVLLQGVHMMVESRPGTEWREGETRRSEVVMIGRGLDRGALQAGLAGCVA